MYDILLKINSQRIGVFAKGRYSVMKRHQWKPLLLICLLLAAPVSAAAAMPIMVAAYTVGMLIFFRFLFDYLRAKFQEAISYELIARDRLAIGDALKRVSLGYFQQMNTGNFWMRRPQVLTRKMNI